MLGCRTGTKFSNAIDLGSTKKVVRNGLSSLTYPDTMLSGCADPEYYDNKTYGDGGDVVGAWCIATHLPVLPWHCWHGHC